MAPALLWLAIRLPALPLDTLLRTQPHDDMPFVVSEQQRVLCLNTAALDAGIVPGMKIATAQALQEQLHIETRRTDLEKQALDSLAQQLLCLTPAVSLLPPDALLLEIGGCLKLFGGHGPILSRAEQLLADAGFQCELGLGHTPLAALHVSLIPKAARPGLVATTAGSAATGISSAQMPGANISGQEGYETERHGIPGSRHAATAQTAMAVLAGLPIAELRRPEKEKEALQAPGLRTLGDLLALPRPALGKRFGKGLLLWIEQLTGERPHPQEPVVPLDTFRSHVEFNEPLHSNEALLFPMQRMLNELMYFLQRQQAEVRALRWQFRGIPSQQQVPWTDTLIVRRNRTDNDGQTWLLLCRRKLEHFTLTGPAITITLTCSAPRPRQPGSEALFTDPNARADYQVLLDKLASLPGLSLSMPQPDNGQLPELGQRDSHPQQTTRPEAFADMTPFQERPLWLLDNPVPLQYRDGLLLLHRQVLDMYPREERLASHWWQQPRLRRYRLARHPSGLHCWVFRDERRKQWFLHGFF